MSSLLDEFALKIPASREALEAVAKTACFRYKIYNIPKRSGRGVRTIAQPAPEVKWLQSIVINEIISGWPVHAAATAYRKKISTAEHAARHAHSKYLMKLDFSDFFHSIIAIDVAHHVARFSPQLSAADQRLLVNILTWKNKMTGVQCLSIGAPSSPFVSNSLMYDFDLKITSFCLTHGVIYSRYADDLAFSAQKPNILDLVLLEVKRTIDLLAHPRLKLNETKTVNVSKKRQRSLVGLILTPDGKISIGRDKKRLLRAKLHRFVMQGLPNDEESHLRGMLAYAWSVEPSFVIRMSEHYGAEVLSRLGISAVTARRESH